VEVVGSNPTAPTNSFDITSAAEARVQERTPCGAAEKFTKNSAADVQALTGAQALAHIMRIAALKGRSSTVVHRSCVPPRVEAAPFQEKFELRGSLS
jgi:hypothetical protein